MRRPKKEPAPEWREVAPGLRVHRNIKDPAALVAAWLRAPARARQVPVSVQLKPPGMAPGGGYWTAYPGVGRLIGLDRAGSIRTFLHELGHHVQSATWSAADAERWSAFYRDHRGLMPRRGGGPADTPEEGAWAQSFVRLVEGLALAPELAEELAFYFGEAP
jgi:hypothetical protein